MIVFLFEFFFFFFFNDTATTEIYTLSLHDALPIWPHRWVTGSPGSSPGPGCMCRSEEHTSELQSQSNLVCRLLLEKKKTKKISTLQENKKNKKNIHNNRKQTK